MKLVIMCQGSKYKIEEMMYRPYVANTEMNKSRKAGYVKRDMNPVQFCPALITVK